MGVSSIILWQLSFLCDLFLRSNVMNGNLQQALRSATTSLSNFALRPSFWQDFGLAFGQGFDRTQATKIRQGLIDQEFSLPVQVVPDQGMGIATGAFAAATDTVYLRESFVAAGDISAISAVIVEEFGHAIDSRVNKIETPGDEGAIFRLLVGGAKIAQNLLSELQAEDDWGTILVDGQQLAVEMAVIQGTGGNDIFRVSDGVGSGQNIVDIYDPGGSGDILELSLRGPGLLGANIIITRENVVKSGTSLVIQNPYNTENVITIHDFFSPTGTPGTGFIENILSVSLAGSRPVLNTDYLFKSSIAVRGDYNGDGKTDILWRSGNTNTVTMWRISGNQVLTQNQIPATLDASWKVVDTGDFNGDRKADVLWTNPDGAVVLWQMDGYTIFTAGLVSAGADPGWSVATAGDFNGDGKNDIFWRNINGDVAIMQMDGQKILSSTVLGKVDSSWKTSMTGDFNGDGKADILWRKDNGDVAMWLMDGTKVDFGGVISQGGADWKIAGVNDFNGDGKSDVIWQNDDGRIALWHCDGATVTFAKVIGDVPGGFTIAATGDYDNNGLGDFLLRNVQGTNLVASTNGTQIVSQSSLLNSFTGSPVYSDPSWRAVPLGLDAFTPPVLLA
jgi:hypothetical protein